MNSRVGNCNCLDLSEGPKVAFRVSLSVVWDRGSPKLLARAKVSAGVRGSTRQKKMCFGESASVLLFCWRAQFFFKDESSFLTLPKCCFWKFARRCCVCTVAWFSVKAVNDRD